MLLLKYTHIHKEKCGNYNLKKRTLTQKNTPQREGQLFNSNGQLNCSSEKSCEVYRKKCILNNSSSSS